MFIKKKIFFSNINTDLCNPVFLFNEKFDKMKRTTSGNVERNESQQSASSSNNNDDNNNDPTRSPSFENDEEESFSLTKSAIDDLPSTAVQSIHIEIPDGQPSLVENIDEEVFTWKEHKMKLAKQRKQRKSSGPNNRQSISKQRSMTKQQQPQRITTNSGNVIVATITKQQLPKRNQSQQTIKTVEQIRSGQRINQANSNAKNKERRDNNNQKKNKKRK